MHLNLKRSISRSLVLTNFLVHTLEMLNLIFFALKMQPLQEWHLMSIVLNFYLLGPFQRQIGPIWERV